MSDDPLGYCCCPFVLVNDEAKLLTLHGEVAHRAFGNSAAPLAVDPAKDNRSGLPISIQTVSATDAMRLACI